MAIPYRTAKFKSANILAITILGPQCRGGSRISGWGGHMLIIAHEIFGHAHIVAANETNSPRCRWNPTFSPYKQVSSYILCQIKVH